MKKKIIIISSILLVIVVAAIWAVPAFADSSPGALALGTPKAKIGALVRLLLVQDEAKVDTYIATAVKQGKLTSEQAVKIKDFWTAHHTQFTRRVVVTRLLKAQDETKVKTFLDKAVSAGKIQQAQADKLIKIWEILHTPVTSTAQ
jgi:uncharacterized glyoxalase superfamily protein PhnB